MIDRPLSIFIASASEGLEVANAVRDALRGYARFDARVWKEGTFKPSMTFIEALEASNSNFGCFLSTYCDHFP
jgi:Predicted nucleotide-binding protein containing TIR-like domain